MSRLVFITFSTPRPPAPAARTDAAPLDAGRPARPRGVLATALAAALTAFAAGLATALGGALAHALTRAVGDALARGAGS